MMMLTQVRSGPIEMSIPPPPERIWGVDAIAASANGANVASVAGHELGVAKLDRARMFATSSANASAVANPHGRARSHRLAAVTGGPPRARRTPPPTRRESGAPS